MGENTHACLITVTFFYEDGRFFKKMNLPFMDDRKSTSGCKGHGELRISSSVTSEIMAMRIISSGLIVFFILVSFLRNMIWKVILVYCFRRRSLSMYFICIFPFNKRSADTKDGSRVSTLLSDDVTTT